MFRVKININISAFGIDAQELSRSLPSIPTSSIPFPAQHVILQALQRHLEGHIFRFVQKWLLAESHAIGWTPPAHSIQRWNRVVSSIRHASVHRILQAPDTLLRMVRYAIGFLESIAGVTSSRSLRRLHRFLKTMLTSSDRLAAQLRDKVNMQILLCNTHPEQLGRRLQLLPEALRRVLQKTNKAWCLRFKIFYSLNLHKVEDNESPAKAFFLKGIKLQFNTF
ncbi:hypothetical protein N7466_001447 [Penicillium verhagenii]|uniref:uncharacterized protein n=1 Tax=Penicillium verhagenii TaxID=1562060 RepID=UPI002545ADC3|nr:uncharacterized protein N7466_001447 [Penicillium verhagenii]KAJ5938313.1 hypothetical protein N7466_001447 [Penicillium verhagenii]